MSSLVIVIVSFNTRDHLRHCLASLQMDNAEAIVVVDNGSTDGSLEMVRANFPHVEVLETGANLGYGGAANRAIAESNADHVLLLNSDTRLPEGGARALQGYLDEHPNCGIVGPRLLNVDGTLQPSCYPEMSPVAIFLDESQLGKVYGVVPWLRERSLRTWRHDHARSVPWVSGAVLAMRRDAFMAIDGFDEDYFMYFEEVDLCRRMREAHWSVDFTPVTSIVHEGGASTRKVKTRMARQLVESAERYFAQYYGLGHVYLYRVLMTPIRIARVVRATLFPKPTEASHVAQN